MGALSHLKVLDLSRVLAGPWASQILADLGAEVIKIERPGVGDDTRAWGPPFMADADGSPSAESAYFLSTNRGKKSVCVDIKSSEGQRALQALARDCDVVIENFKVGDASRYGLGHSDLSKINPELVYCSITGFGQNGPMQHRPGYDFMIQAMAGLMSITGAPDEQEGGGPQKVGVALTDIMTGLYATIGILAALAERERSGLGQHVDMALFDVTAASLANQASNYLVGGINPTRLGNAHPNIVPYQSFVVADGHIVVAVGNDSQFRRFVEVLGAAELADDPRYCSNENRVENRDALVPILQRSMLDKTKERWLALFEAANVPAGPINTVAEVFESEQAEVRGLWVELDHPLNPSLKLPGSPIKLSRTPVSYGSAPPLLGEHTDEVLATLERADMNPKKGNAKQH